jgi:energy-coupling factor transport system permease protein
VIYRRRATPLHAARASVACAYCLALALCALLLSAPIVLGAVLLALAGAGVGAGVPRELRRALLWGLPLAVMIVVINALVAREGLTVIWRLGRLPVLGQVDITLEATAYGGVLALRALALILCGALYSLAVDPDEVLRMFRRISFRSALTATLATRMVPVLIRDSRRLADAQRCRPGRPPSRVQLLRAATAGVLDRALDVAAALEVSGYAIAKTPPRRHRPWSRHDLAFAAAAAALLAIAVLGRALGLEPFQAYPALHAPLGGAEAGLAIGLLAAALAPFGTRRGVAR